MAEFARIIVVAFVRNNRTAMLEKDIISRNTTVVYLPYVREITLEYIFVEVTLTNIFR